MKEIANNLPKFKEGKLKYTFLPNYVFSCLFILNWFSGIGKHGKSKNLSKQTLPSWEDNEHIVDSSKI